MAVILWECGVDVKEWLKSEDGDCYSPRMRAMISREMFSGTS